MELIDVTNTEIKKQGAAPGVQVVAKGKGLSNVTAEFSTPPGIEVNPPKGYKGIISSYGKTDFMFTGFNYMIAPDTEQGGLKIYSTDAAGKTLKSYIYLKPDGTIEMKSTQKIKVTNTTKSLATILKTLIQHIESITTTNAVQGSPCALSPDSIADLAQDSAELLALLEE